MMLKKNLFEEAEAVMATPPETPSSDGGFKSPYTVSNQEALARELDSAKKNIDLLADDIIEAYKKNEFSLKIGMSAEPNFDRFVALLQNTFTLNEILVDAPEIRKKLAELISLAYFHAQKDPSKKFMVYSNKDTANQVTEAIMQSLISSLKMNFLTYNTEFANLLKKAIFSVILYTNPKKQKSSSESVK
jgi:hypothetical protein